MTGRVTGPGAGGVYPPTSEGDQTPRRLFFGLTDVA